MPLRQRGRGRDDGVERQAAMERQLAGGEFRGLRVVRLNLAPVAVEGEEGRDEEQPRRCRASGPLETRRADGHAGRMMPSGPAAVKAVGANDRVASSLTSGIGSPAARIRDHR